MGVMLGDFDWEALRAVGPFPAICWFWLVVWLMQMIMLNMLLAMIMDAYMKTKGSVGRDAKTVVGQGADLARQWWRKRHDQYVDLEDIMNALAPSEELPEQDRESLFTRAHLLDNVAG